MNGSLGRLGELYNLSPTTVAGLAAASGQQAPAAAPPPAPATPPPAEGSYDWWAQGAPPGSTQDVRPGETMGDVQQRRAAEAGKDMTMYAPSQADSPEEARRKALAAANPQGPEADDFPTVKVSSGAGGMGGAGSTMPVRAVPAHWQPGGHSVALHHGMSPGELEEGRTDRDVASGQQMLAADKKLEAAQQAGMADAVYASANQMITQQTADRIAAIKQRRDQYVASEQKKLEDLSAKAQREVDPNSYFKEKGTAAQVAMSLMAGLNQFAVMWRGRGENTSMRMIDEAIQRNVDAQKTNIANARQALAGRESMYDRNLAAFGDAERAELATRIQYLDQVKAMADGQRIKAKGTENEAAYNDMIGQLYERRAQTADQFAKLTHTDASEQMSEHYVPTQYVGGGTGQKGKEALYVPTLGGYARDEKTAQLLNQKGSLRMQIGENMRQIHQLLGEAQTLNSVTDRPRLMQLDELIAGKVSDTLTKNTVLEGQGAMSDGDKAVAAEAKNLKGLSVQWKPDMVLRKHQENVKAASMDMLTQHRIEGEAYGVQKGTEQYVAGPDGPTAVRRLEGRNATPSKNTQGYDDLVQKPKGVPQARK